MPLTRTPIDCGEPGSVAAWSPASLECCHSRSSASVRAYFGFLPRGSEMVLFSIAAAGLHGYGPGFWMVSALFLRERARLPDSVSNGTEPYRSGMLFPGGCALIGESAGPDYNGTSRSCHCTDLRRFQFEAQAQQTYAR